MKIFSKIIFPVLALLFLWGACTKEETQALLSPSAALSATLSANSLVLAKDNAATDALTVSWATPSFGFAAAPTYNVFVDKKGNNFAKAVAISAGTDLKKVFKTSELNSILTGLGLQPGTAGDLDFKVECLIGAATKYVSPIINLNATPYSEKLDLSTIWGVVGDATANGWNGPDQPVYKTAVANELVAYVTLVDGNIKFRTNNDWALNLGGSAGKLAVNGDNIPVKKGTYKVTFNPVALTYAIVPLSWGIVGDATANGWNGPDQAMRYDATVDMWRAEVKLGVGAVKFRLNNDWGTNFGGSAGKLANGGDNIAVAAAGTYLITADFNKLVYTVTPFKPIGIVGDATPNGWNGPDTKFTKDLSTPGAWYLNGVVLTAAQIKFRENDDWANNWGATGTVEPAPVGTGGGLAAGGKNFGVTAGTWNFVLDFSDAANPKYKATKVK